MAAVFLPRYFRGELQTAYAFLGDRFGDGMRGMASVTFLVTRLLADGVRLFATAIPIQVVARAAGFEVGYPAVILAIGVVTAAYTYVGGLKAVVWMDVVQMGIYVGGAVVALGLLATSPAAGSWAAAAAAGKLQVVDLGLSEGLGVLAHVALRAARVGARRGRVRDGLARDRPADRPAHPGVPDAGRGAPGDDLERRLRPRSSSRSSSWSGSCCWVHYGGAALADLGLTRGDELFPLYILNEMPPGLRGLLLAGIVAAAMSTLSSSLNALAGSTLMDLLERFGKTPRTPEQALALSRVLTLVWAGVFVGFAMLFTGLDNPVVELGLGIAGFTYGGLLGAFLLGLVSRRARQADAMVAFGVTIVAMVLLIFGLWWSTEMGGWVVDWRPSPDTREALGLRAVAWPLYPVIGSALTVGLGLLLRDAAPGADPAAGRQTDP